MDAYDLWIKGIAAKARRMKRERYEKRRRKALLHAASLDAKGGGCPPPRGKSTAT
jgi:hypothetical protein